jgi:hypothetical protein
MSVSALLECLKVTTVGFRWNLAKSKESVSARLECLMVNIGRFSISLMCHGQNRPVKIECSMNQKVGLTLDDLGSAAIAQVVRRRRKRRRKLMAPRPGTTFVAPGKKRMG